MTTGIKKLYAVEDLKIGMFVSSLDTPMASTPFPLQGFYIRKKEEILELSQYCRFVMVNITKSRAVKSLNSTLHLEVVDIPRAFTDPVGFKLAQQKRVPKKNAHRRKGRVNRLLVLLVLSLGILYLTHYI